MMAPPTLCGEPELLKEEKPQEQQSNKQQHGEHDDDDDDDVLDPVLPLRKFHFIPSWVSRDEANNGGGLILLMKAYVQLPPTDALALLDGDDHTGMMIWQGSARMCQHLFDNFLPLLRPNEAFPPASGDVKKTPDRNDNNDDQTATKNNAKDSSSSSSLSSSSSSTTTTTAKLMMSAFVKESFDEQAVRDFEHVDTVVEIGCGSGILGLVAGYVLKAKSIIMTDGNKECSDLAELNFNLNYERAFRGFSTVGRGKQLMWRDLSGSEVSELLFLHRKNLDFTPESSLVICGGDVVYSLDSVVPLVDTIHSLAVNFLDVRNSVAPPELDSDEKAKKSKKDMGGRAHFFLCFYPRQWYVETNRILLENVKDKLKAKGWKLILEAGCGDNEGTLLHFVFG